jgi:hypothetical protein
MSGVSRLLRFPSAVALDPAIDAWFDSRDSQLGAIARAFTAHVNIGFFRGATLPDPAGLLQGNGKYMRHVKLRPGTAVDVSSLETLITVAYLDISMRLLDR